MTLGEARARLYREFLSALDDLDAAATLLGQRFERSQLTLDNEEYNPTPDKPWMRLVVRHEARQQAAFGSESHKPVESEGRALVQVFVPGDTRNALSDALASVVSKVYSLRRFGELVTRAAEVRESGADGEWYMVLVDVRFLYRETLAR